MSLSEDGESREGDSNQADECRPHPSFFGAIEIILLVSSF